VHQDEAMASGHPRAVPQPHRPKSAGRRHGFCYIPVRFLGPAGPSPQG